MKIDWKLLIMCFAAVFVVAFLGSLVTDIGPWYDSWKSPIKPPNFVFPIVWTILFAMIAVSLYLALSKKKHYFRVITVFGVNLALNFLWSLIFFGWKQGEVAFFEIIILWISILVMIISLWKIDKRSALLLIPYLLWVLFAGYLLTTLTH